MVKVLECSALVIWCMTLRVWIRIPDRTQAQKVLEWVLLHTVHQHGRQVFRSYIWKIKADGQIKKNCRKKRLKTPDLLIQLCQCIDKYKLKVFLNITCIYVQIFASRSAVISAASDATGRTAESTLCRQSWTKLYLSMLVLSELVFIEPQVTMATRNVKSPLEHIWLKDNWEKKWNVRLCK